MFANLCYNSYVFALAFLICDSLVCWGSSIHLIEACLLTPLGSAGMAATKLTFLDPPTIEEFLERNGRVEMIPSDFRSGNTGF